MNKWNLKYETEVNTDASHVLIALDTHYDELVCVS